jgi:hypothetical protein
VYTIRFIFWGMSLFRYDYIHCSRQGSHFSIAFIVKHPLYYYVLYFSPTHIEYTHFETCNIKTAFGAGIISSLDDHTCWEWNGACFMVRSISYTSLNVSWLYWNFPQNCTSAILRWNRSWAIGSPSAMGPSNGARSMSYTKWREGQFCSMGNYSNI